MIAEINHYLKLSFVYISVISFLPFANNFVVAIISLHKPLSETDKVVGQQTPEI